MSITDSACNKASRPIKKEAIVNIAEATGDIWVDDTCAYGLEWLRTTPGLVQFSAPLHIVVIFEMVTKACLAAPSKIPQDFQKSASQSKTKEAWWSGDANDCEHSL